MYIYSVQKPYIFKKSHPFQSVLNAKIHSQKKNSFLLIITYTSMCKNYYYSYSLFYLDYFAPFVSFFTQKKKKRVYIHFYTHHYNMHARIFVSLYSLLAALLSNFFFLYLLFFFCFLSYIFSKRTYFRFYRDHKKKKSFFYVYKVSLAHTLIHLLVDFPKSLYRARMTSSELLLFYCYYISLLFFLVFQ